MTALSELLPAGGAGKVMDFVASGALPNGSPVILKSDGTVEVVGESPISESIPAGSEVVFNATSTSYISIAFDPNTAGKFVIAYSAHDGTSSFYGTAIVGTVSGTAISFGSGYVFNSGGSVDNSITFDPNDSGKFVISYRDAGNSNYGTAVVGTVSGTTLSFGTAVVFNAGSTDYGKASFDPNNAGKFVVAYKDISNGTGNGTAIVGTVSGTSLSFGTEVVFEASRSDFVSMSFDPNDSGKFVVVYRDLYNSYYGTVVVGTISGTTLSFGTVVVYNSGNSGDNTVAFDPNTTGKFVIAYRDNGNSDYSTAIVGTVSGTSLSFGSEYIFKTGFISGLWLSFDPNNAGKFVVAYKDHLNSSYGTAIVGTVSGTTLTFGSDSVFSTGSSFHISTSFDPNNAGKFVVTYLDFGNSNYGTSIVGQIAAPNTNLTTTNFVGITSKAISDTATGSITLQGGVSTNQSSLTSGSTYYVQGDGTVSTVSTAPAVNIGKALNATTLKLKGLSV